MGGINGETDPLDRDPVNNVTVLSGAKDDPYEDVCGPGNKSCFEDNGTPGCDDELCCLAVCQVDPYCCEVEWDQICVNRAIDICDGSEVVYGVYHVVTADNVNTSVILDGFNIINGWADGSFEDGVGGGMVINNASPVVIRVTFTDNTAPSHGGGAMNIAGSSDPIVVNTSFIENSGYEAGAIHTEFGTAGGTFVNCLFRENTSQIEGGAINPGSNGTLTFINCTFADNSVVSTEEAVLSTQRQRDLTA